MFAIFAFHGKRAPEHPEAANKSRILQKYFTINKTVIMDIVMVMMIVILGCLILAGIYNKITIDPMPRKQALNARARSPVNTGNILVVIPTTSEYQVRQLLEQAYIPQRVTILTTTKDIEHRQVRRCLRARNHQG